MYAICSVVKNDVLKAVKEMVKKGYNFPVIQVSKKQYKELDQDHGRDRKSTRLNSSHYS